MTVRHQAYYKKIKDEEAAQEEAAQRKLQRRKIAKSTAKRMITRRAEQASNQERRENA